MPDYRRARTVEGPASLPSAAKASRSGSVLLSKRRAPAHPTWRSGHHPESLLSRARVAQATNGETKSPNMGLPARGNILASPFARLSLRGPGALSRMMSDNQISRACCLIRKCLGARCARDFQHSSAPSLHPRGFSLPFVQDWGGTFDLTDT